MKLTKAQKKKVIEILTPIVEDKVVGLYHVAGLCDRIYTLSNGTVLPSLVMERYSESWSRYSGSSIYPIPTTGGYTCARKCFHNVNLWEGEQLELRIDLSRHIISKMQKELDQSERNIFLRMWNWLLGGSHETN